MRSLWGRSTESRPCTYHAQYIRSTVSKEEENGKFGRINFVPRQLHSPLNLNLTAIRDERPRRGEWIQLQPNEARQEGQPTRQTLTIQCFVLTASLETIYSLTNARRNHRGPIRGILAQLGHNAQSLCSRHLGTTNVSSSGRSSDDSETASTFLMRRGDSTTGCKIHRHQIIIIIMHHRSRRLREGRSSGAMTKRRTHLVLLGQSLVIFHSGCRSRFTLELRQRMRMQGEHTMPPPSMRTNRETATAISRSAGACFS